MNKKLHWKQSRFNGGYIIQSLWFQILLRIHYNELQSRTISTQGDEITQPHSTLPLSVLCLEIIWVSLFILGRWFVNLNNLLHSKLQLALCMGGDAMLGARCTRLISHRIHTVPINAAGEDYLQSVRTLLGVNVKCAQFPFPLIIPAMCMSAPRPSSACVCVSSGHWWGVRVMGQSVSTGPDLSPLSLSISVSWPRDYFCHRPCSLLASDWLVMLSHSRPLIGRWWAIIVSWLMGISQSVGSWEYLASVAMRWPSPVISQSEDSIRRHWPIRGLRHELWQS